MGLFLDFGSMPPPSPCCCTRRDVADYSAAAGFHGHPFYADHLRATPSAFAIHGIEHVGEGAGQIGAVLQQIILKLRRLIPDHRPAEAFHAGSV